MLDSCVQHQISSRPVFWALFSFSCWSVYGTESPAGCRLDKNTESNDVFWMFTCCLAGQFKKAFLLWRERESEERGNLQWLCFHLRGAQTYVGLHHRTFTYSVIPPSFVHKERQHFGLKDVDESTSGKTVNCSHRILCGCWSSLPAPLSYRPESVHPPWWSQEQRVNVFTSLPWPGRRLNPSGRTGLIRANSWLRE